MAPRTEVSFELERLALEGDELVVSGFWRGVRGMRFVRPTLLYDDRRILATLEHKPWAPSDDALWTAAFPWTGGRPLDERSLALAVAPRVIVQLGETATGAPAAAKAATPAAAAKPAKTTAAAKAATPAAAAKPAKTTAAAKAARPAAAAKPAKATAPAKAATRAPAAKRAKATPAAGSAPAAKATRAAKAAKPTPAAKPSRAPKPATAATPAPAPAAKPAPLPASNGAPPPTPPVIPVDVRSDDLARALAAVERERDRAIAQRDEVLIAYTALQRQLQAEHAQADRHARGEKDRDETDPDAPLGVRTVPAVRGVLAELQYPPREPKRRLARFDLWVVRLIGLAAAGCFLALLLSIVRVVN